MRYVELVFGLLAGVAIVNLLFSAPNTAAVISSTTGGLSGLFGTLIKPGGSTLQQSQLSSLGFS